MDAEPIGKFKPHWKRFLGIPSVSDVVAAGLGLRVVARVTCKPRLQSIQRRNDIERPDHYWWRTGVTPLLFEEPRED
jgi:hypothetical protein